MIVGKESKYLQLTWNLEYSYGLIAVTFKY